MTPQQQRMAAYLAARRRLLAQQVTCPYCKAAPGQPCVSLQRNPMGVMHGSRYAKSEEAN